MWDRWFEQAAQTLGPWAGQPWIQAAAIVVLSLVVAQLSDWIATGVVRGWTRRTRTDLDDRILAMLHRPVFVSVLLIGLWLALSRLNPGPAVEMWSLRLFKTVAIAIWALFALRFTSLLIERASRLEHRISFIEPRTVALFDNLSRLVLISAAVYALFLSWGIDVGGVLLGAGVMGIAFGLAAKDTLANLFSGIFILADAPYKLGDFIVLDTGERGMVTQIGLRSTRLLTRDDIEVTIPNAVIANAKIVNESGGPWEKERVRVRVGVAYGSDVDRVREVLQEIASEHPDIDAEPAPRVRLRAFGESSLDFELLGWIHEPVLRGRVLDSLLTQVYKRFAAEGIEIPYPKRDVYLRR